MADTPQHSYDDVVTSLRQAYNSAVEENLQKKVALWKQKERAHFLALLRSENRHTLLEIGAGTGIHGWYFQDSGIDVTCTDLAPNMVASCHRRGLKAHVMDFLNLNFSADSFDAVFAMNCLLHVPRDVFPTTLSAVSSLLSREGLLYLGQYGGVDEEGIRQEDRYEPKRFFSRMSDDAIKRITAEFFDLISFRRVAVAGPSGQHFQSLTLRRRMPE